MFRALLAVALALIVAVPATARKPEPPPPTPSVAQNVLDAEPTVQIESSEDATKRVVLPSEERARNKVIIIKQGEKYLWASREGRELAHHVSGSFHYFVAPGGAGYVKVFAVPAKQRGRGAHYYFMEHVTVGMASISYWGETEMFNL